MGNDATVRIAGDVGALLSALLSGKLGMRDFIKEVQAGMRDAAAEMQGTTKGAGDLEGGMTSMIAKGTFLGGMLKDLAMGALRLVKDAVMAVVGEFVRGVQLSNEFNTALTGLRAVAAGTGNDLKKTEQAAKDFASNGLMTISSSATSLKNLLATGFSLPEAIKLMKVAGDSAAFNRQGMLGYGEAVERFTQGIKFNNSALTDSTGLGKNLSVIMKEAGMSTDAAGNASNSAAVRQAILNGFMKEGALFTGNAAKYTETYGGQLARLTSTYNTFLATLGDAVTKNQTVISVMGILSDAFGTAGKSMNFTQTMANLVSDAIVLIVKSVGWLLSALDFLQQAWYQGKVASALFDASLQSIILQLNRAQLAFLEFVAKMDPTGLAAKALSGTIQGLKDQVNASRFAMEQAADAAGKNDQKWKENSATITGWKASIADAVVKLEATRGKLVEMEFATDNVNKKTEAAAKLTKEQIAAAKKWAGVMDELNTAGKDYQATLESIDGETVSAIKYYLEAGVSQAVLAKAYALTDVQIKAVVSSMKDEKDLLTIMAGFRKQTYELSVKADKDFRAEQQRLIKVSNDATAKSLIDTGKLWDDHYDGIAKRTLSNTDYQILKAHEWADDERKKLDTSNMNWRAHSAAILATERDKVAAIKLANNPVYQDWKRLTSDMAQAWDGLFVAALHGADSFKSAIKGVFTTLKNDVIEIFAEILKAFLEGLIRKMILGGQQQGGGMSSMFSGLLSGAGTSGGGASGGASGGGWLSGLGKLIGGGGGAGAGAGVGSAASGISPYIASGSIGMQAMPALGSAGTQGAGAASGAAGAGAAGVAAGGLMAAGGIFQMATAKTRSENIMGGMTAGAGIGTMILPGWGTAIGAGIGFGVGLVKSYMGVSQAVKDARKDVAGFEEKLASTLNATQRLEAGNEPWKMSVIAVRDAYVATGRTSAEAEADVKKLWESSKGGAKAAADAMIPINAAMEKQAVLLEKAKLETARLYAEAHPDFAGLEGVASKYGVTLAALGPKFAQARITTTAGDIMKAFQALEQAGANADMVLAGMKDEIQAVVQESLKFGSEVPASMEPLILQLIKTGQLFDDNGKAITDIGTIKFAPPIEKASDDAATAIDGVGTSVDGVTDKLHDSATAGEVWADSFERSAGRVRAAVDAVSIGSSFGGIKEWVPMLRKSQDAFRDVASVAVNSLGSVKKAINIGVLPRSSATAADVARSPEPVGGGGEHIHVHMHGVIDGHSVELTTEQKLLPAMIKVLSRGRSLRELKQILES